MLVRGILSVRVSVSCVGYFGGLRVPPLLLQCTYLSLENSLHSSKTSKNASSILRNFETFPSKFRESSRIVVRIFAGTFAYNFESVKTIALSKIRRKFGDISFRSKHHWFSSKSGEMSRNSSKFALITFAQYCTR